ncbi:MAG: LCP family protein [Clostridiales bacterium]|nr:LCP family protein [Clostridiales bacterium]
MKKPIDPNLNSFDDDFLFEADKSGKDTKENPNCEDNLKITENEFKSEYDTVSSEHSMHSHGSGHHSHNHRSSRHRRRKKKKMPLVFRILIVILALIFLAVAVIGGTFLYLRETGRNDLTKEPANPKYVETIEYNGHTYVYDANKIAFAFIGVDKESISETGSVIGNSGQADTDIVGTIDTSSGEVKLISIPRDTMVDIDLYTTSGEFIKTENMQLCLAYAYGDGGESSCRNVLTAISRVLVNVPVEKYFALDLSGIAPLNDAIGGVTLTSLYDFPEDGVKKGDEVKIKGDFAETYVRKRSLDNINASLNRTERQTQYLKAYIQQLQSAVANNFSVVSDLYNTASKYSQTNISLNNVTFLASIILANGVSDYQQYTLEGEMKASESDNDNVFAEFYPDEDSVMNAVLNCFYRQVN